MAPKNPQFSLYLPRSVLAWQAERPDERLRREHGTLVFADLSGFTPLVERAGAQGQGGAEVVSDLINEVFDETLTVAIDEGGDILQFGGDASMIWFTGPDHAERAALVALDMQDALTDLDRPELGISIGIDSGEIALVLAGDRHRELLVFGPAVDGALTAEKIAERGEVRRGRDAELVSDADDPGTPFVPPTPPSGDALDLADYIPTGVRDALTVAGSNAEHRQVCAAFIRLDVGDIDLDVLPVDAIERIASVVQEEAERHEVALLGSDSEIGGVKFLLAAGAPHTTHHDEERLLRTLRAVLDRVDDEPVEIRIGVTRGRALAGDFGAVSRRYYTLLGDAVNLAARLMSIADDRQILTLDSVLDRSPTRFAATALAPVKLKGKSKHVTPMSVGPVTGVDRLDWAQFLPLVGRDAAMQRLGDHVAELREGRSGGAIEIVGPSGIGKSRLLAETLDRALLVDSYQLICERYEHDTPYFLAGHLIRGVLGLKPNSDAAEVLVRLDDELETHPSIAPWRPLIAVPLGLDVESTPEVDALSEDFRAAQLHVAVEALLAAAHPEPFIIAAEDAQWLDPASAGLLDHLAKIAVERNWLLLSTRDGASGRLDADHTITLPPLDDDELGHLLRLAAREHPTSDATIDAIVAMSDGHPFFALELVRHGDGDRLPESVEAVVAHRIDQLTARDRQLLRYVSVLGNSFSFDLLAEALPQVAPSTEDTETWQRLADFLDVTVFGTVQFRQDLVRHVAYNGLTVRRRTEVHGIVAEAIERRARRRANRQAALLSRHFHLAERWEASWKYSRIAAEAAKANRAVVEALDLYRRALEAARHLEIDGSDVAETAEAGAVVALPAGALDAGTELIERALADEDATDAVLARRRRLAATFLREQGELSGALAELERARSMVEHDDAEDTQVEHVEVLVGLAGVLHRMGDEARSNEFGAEAIDLAERVGHRSGYAAAASIMVTNDVHLGHAPNHERVREALAIFDELGDPHGAAKVRNNLGLQNYFAGDWTEAAREWDLAGDLYRSAGDAIGAATVDNNLGEILSDQGRLDDAEDRFENALRAWRAASFGVGVALATQNLGRVEARRGRRAAADARFTEALTGFESNGQAGYVADTLLRRVEAAAFAGDYADVASLLSALPSELASTLTASRDRLAALVELDAAAMRTVAESASAPYDRAHCLELVAQLTDDPDAAAEAAEIFASLDATNATRFPLPR